MKKPKKLRLIALTGTPGVGKSSAASELRKAGYRAIDTNALVKKRRLFSSRDRKRNTLNADIGRLDKYVTKMIESLAEREGGGAPPKHGAKRNCVRAFGCVFLEGHLSHLLSVDAAIVLRCEPKKLKARLSTRGWPRRKVEENVDAEILDVVLIDALENCGEVYEINTTKMGAKGVARAVIDIINGKTKKYNTGKVDWSKTILERY